MFGPPIGHSKPQQPSLELSIIAPKPCNILLILEDLSIRVILEEEEVPSSFGIG